MPDLVLMSDHEAARLQFAQNVVFGELTAISESHGIVRSRWHINVRKKARELCRIRDRLMDLGVQPARYGFEKFAIAPSCGERWLPTFEEMR